MSASTPSAGLPDDATRVEIIGGEIVVSPGPRIGRNGIVYDVQEPFVAAAAVSPSFPWRIIQVTDLNLAGIGDGHVPDLLCLDSDTFVQLRTKDSTFVLPNQAALAVEITSPSNAVEDRRPGPRRERATKWAGYAREGVPFYLLIDRDPKMCEAILYSDPDRETGRYRAATCRPFGEPIGLPEPFGVEIPTASWLPWGA